MDLFSALLFWFCHFICLLVAAADGNLRGRYDTPNWISEYLPSPPHSRKRELNVFGNDNRTVFPNQPPHPFSAVGKVITPNWNCTGVMVGPSLMLTSQWCIKSMPGSLTVEELWFLPAYYQGDYMGAANATDYFYDYEINFTESLTAKEVAFDYVVVKLDDSIGNNVGYWQPLEYNVQWNGEELWAHIGYAPDVQSGESPFYIINTPIDSVSTHPLSDGTEAYLMRTSSIDVGVFGQSGGPVFGFAGEEATDPVIVGVISFTASDGSHNTIAGGPGMVAQIAELRQTYG